MKKTRISVMAALAFVLAIASAFASKKEAEAAARQATTYYWFNAAGSYVRTNPLATEQSLTGCSSTKAVCENGYTGDQFNIQDDPSSGLVSGASPQRVIRRSTN